MGSTRYTDAEIDIGLTALVFHGGNTSRAGKTTGIPQRTLHDWLRVHAGRYEELQQTLAPQIAEKIAAQAEAFALRANTVEDKLLERIEKNADQLTPDQASGALRNVTTSKALQVDKISSPLRGRPTVIVETRDVASILDVLASRLGIEPTTNGTATELTDDSGTAQIPAHTAQR